VRVREEIVTFGVPEEIQVDENGVIGGGQHLTPHEVKTIITRAGENTKIVFTGDVHQIDTPYLDENSNGLAYLIDRLKGQPLFARVRLEKGERSELANLANDLL
jgi:PhoH-like ATPase